VTQPATAADVAEVVALVQAQASARQRLVDSASAAVVALLPEGDGWWSSSRITAMARGSVRAVEAAQRTMAATTDAYLARVASVEAGRRVGPVGAGAALKIASLRGGVAHEDVYGRLADGYRWLRSTGVSAARAQRRTVERVSVVVETDVSLAMRDQARRFMVVRRVDGWRRIVRPELSRSGVCGLCLVAADRVYRKSDLMPLHARCKCEVLPIINGVDPGMTITGEDLGRIYTAAGGSTSGKALKRVRYAVRQHGELGPVLVNGDHEFRGPAAVAA